MKNGGTLINNQRMDVNLSSVGVFPFKTSNFSLHAIYSGTPNGTLLLQCSNDPTDVPSEIVNWNDIADSTVTVTSADKTMYNLNKIAYKWLRIVYLASSGDGYLTVNYYSTPRSF